jgi:eukaryotic-like serine/threonine-protein kinase
MPSPQNREEVLLAAALETPADKRPALLDAMCVGDPALRQRLETRLTTHDKPEPLPPPDPSAVQATMKLDLAEPEDETVGKTIGRYKILEKVGEGGCGVVYVAEQTEPVRRRVALKVIKLGMDTKQVIARFEAERQALAMMDHPSIAKALDAGATETGRPFFVMELVRGIRITNYCDQNHLTTKERLNLFIKVCQAIQHAHQKGIIHRDIKPSNILVTLHDGVPVPKVIDFGIAKATEGRLTDATVYTQMHQFIGTPAYMSPEQAEMSGLDIDTRSDIYSLGVLLYELLVGRTPFDPFLLSASGLDAMRKTIRENEPVWPSTRFATLRGQELTAAAKQRSADSPKVFRQLKGDLDWIVMKCLEKDRTRRFETANGLAADLQRHLRDEPVTAGPPSTAYRMRKFVRRNRAVVIAGGLVVLALVLGLVAAAYGLRQAIIARDGEAAAKQAAEHEAERAKVAEAQTKAQADELRLVSDFQAGMLSQINVTDAGLKLMSDLRQRFAATLAASQPPLAEDERARRMAALETDLRSVNATDTAATMIDQTILKPAIATIDKQFKNQPEVDATLRQTVAQLYVALGRYDEAGPLQERALETRRKVLGPEHKDTLNSMDDMGVLLQYQGKLTEAESYLRQTLEIRRRLLGRDNLETLDSMDSLGMLLFAQGKLAEAEPLIRETLEKRRRIQGEEHTNTLTSIESLGVVLRSQGKFAEAEAYLREAMDKKRRVFGEEGPETLVAIGDMSLLLWEQGRLAEAEAYYRELLEKDRHVLGEEHPGTLSAIANLGSLLKDEGKLAEAEPYYREALEKYRRVLGEEHFNTVTAIHNMGTLLKTEGKLTEAEPYFREATEKYRRLLGEEHRYTLTAIGNLGSLLLDQGRLDEAEPLLREALAKRQRVLGEDHPDTLASIVSMGELRVAQGRNAEAVAVLVPIEDKLRAASADSNTFRVARLLTNLGKARAGLAKDHADFALAEANLLEAHRIYVKTPGPIPRDTRDCTQALADFYAAWDKAEPDQGHQAQSAEWKATLKGQRAAQDKQEAGQDK